MKNNKEAGRGRGGQQHNGNNRKKGRQSKEERANRFSGSLSVNSRGTGFLEVAGFEEDVEIENQALRTALDGDEVEIVLLPRVKNQRQRGEVVKIVRRSKMQFVGAIEKTKGGAFLVPDDKKMYADIFVPEDEARDLKDGDKALVRIVEWKHQKMNPRGEIVRALGRKGEHEAEMQSIIAERGIVQDFPADVDREADDLAKREHPIPEAEIARRKDYRGTLTFTIDPADAKDFDDALSLKNLGNGLFEIGVHIADVSHYVREGTALDAEARKRGFSVYLVDRTIPMLPEVLSNDLASLNPEEDKLAFSAVFEMDVNGAVRSRWFGKTVIRSDRRFAYEDAQKLLDAKQGLYYDELRILNGIAKSLRSERYKQGAIDFDTTEIKFRLDEKGKPIDVYEKPRLDTHKLIEEFMLLANREVAEHIFKMHSGKKAAGPGKPFIYRIHDLPDKDRLAGLSLFIEALGFKLGGKGGNVSAQDIARLLEDVEGASQESLIKTAAIRSMAKAVYSTKNIGHFGLAFKHYTHFTSPIRRYPDLIVHRLLEAYLTNPRGGVGDFAKYERIAAESSEKEVAAAEAERASIKYKQVEFLKDSVGKEFDAVVSGVTEWGVYVEEVRTHAEGLVRVRDMQEDYFSLDEKTYSLVGERTKRRYTLGDKVKVRLVAADLDRKTLDFKFV